MGRKPYKNLNLPKGMRARHRGNNIYYYLDTGARPRKEIPLGKDYAMAVQKWSELTMNKAPGVITFAHVAEKYFIQVVPTKAERTQDDNRNELKTLLKFFDNPPAPIDQIEPKHIRLYMDWRIEYTKSEALKSGKEIRPNMGSVRANREKALFSHIFNFAREYGYTSKENPCQGVKGFKERGRKDIYISDEMFNKVLAVADKPTQFALRLAYLTGQRPSDVLKMKVSDINNGFLLLRQNKTKEKIRIIISGELKTLLDEVKIYKQSRPIQNISLLVNEQGSALKYTTFRGRFTNARKLAGIEIKDFQFKDLRAKAATDVNEQDNIKKSSNSFRSYK